MLHDLGWQSLDGRRQDKRSVLFYKIINGLASVETEDILTPADSRSRKNHSIKFKHLQANCDSLDGRQCRNILILITDQRCMPNIILSPASYQQDSKVPD